MKTTRLFSVLMAICLSLGVYAVDWSSIGWVDASDNKYKVEAVEGLGVVNVQQPPWATERGIYVTVPAGISNVSVASSIDGAGAVLHLSAFTAQETKVTITHGTGTIDFLVYYADGTAGGGGEETPEPAVNLALNKPATAGANAEGGAVAVNDGNFGSRWASGAGAHHVGQAKPSDQIVTEEQSQDWCYVDLGAEVAIDSVRFLFEGAAPIHFKVFTSNDAETWTLQVENTENPKTGNTAEFYNVYPFATAVTARYVKFLGLTAVNFEWGIKIYEMEVFSGAENVALNKTAKAGNNEGAVADAIDGDPASLWVSEPSALHYGKPILAGTYTEEEAQDWIYVDLAGIYNLDSVRFLFEGACPTDFDILTSNDAIAWTKQLNITDAPKIGNNAESYNTYAFPSPVEARYVKIFARKAVQANFDYGISIWEFEVYGSAVADTEKPVLTSATLESVTYAEAKIKIVATDNLAVTQCQVTDATNGIDGKYPVDGDILTISGLTPSTTYNFTIQALDGAGNASEATKEVSATTTAHYYEPNVAAPVPTVAASLVKAIYSDTYGATTLGFEDWGGGYAAADKVIDSDNYKMLNTTAGSYLGLVFAGVNATGMKYWHLDIWAENDGTIRIFPIWGGAEYNQTVTLKGQQWNSIELVLATDYPSIDNWSNIYQIKFDNTSGNNLAVDNIYFYTDPIEDEEKPTNVTAVLASASYTSAVLTCQAEDNSGNVSFDVYNGDTKVGTGGAESGKPATITVNNLEAGKEHTLSVEAYDQNGNKAERVEVKVTTIALPAPAPAPTAAAEDVWSIYSDAYTPAQAWIFGGWSQSTVPVEYSLAENNKAYLLQNFNYLGFEIAGNTPTDLSAYEYIHIDVYTTSDALNFKITPISAGDPNKEGAVTVPTTPNAWTSIDLPLDGFGPYEKSKNIQIKVEGAADCFIDNLYFYKSAAEPLSFELNGGTLAEVPADNAALWELFKPAFNSYYNLARADQTMANAATFMTVAQDFMTNAASPWKWLGDYIILHAPEILTSDPANIERTWRFTVTGFFNGVASHWAQVGDWTEASKPESWANAYKFGNAPTKKAHKFLGWFDNEACEGDALTACPAGGKIYAKWEVLPLEFVVNGGTLAEVPADNAALWELFKPAFNSYYDLARADQTMANAATFMTVAQDFMTNAASPWKWLGDYIILHAPEILTSDPANIERTWRFTVTGFFNGVASHWAQVGDWTEASKPESWANAYKYGNAPTKEGYEFTGWYETEACDGEALTTLPIGGTIYAGWKETIVAPTYLWITPNYAEVVAGDSLLLTVGYEPENAVLGEITWSLVRGSELATIVPVAGTNTAWLKANADLTEGGQVEVKAAANGIETEPWAAVFAITIPVKAPESITITSETGKFEVEALGTLQLTATINPVGEYWYLWEISDDQLATISSTGLVTSLTKEGGKVTVTAKVEGFEDVQSSVEITLLPEETTGLDNVNVEVKTTKVLRDGQLIIIRDEEEYTILGTKIQ